MKLSVDDPKLTAYALGELDANERAEVERELANAPECRAAVEEIRQMAGLLSEGLANEPAPRLTEAQREVVVQGITEAPKPANVVPFPRRRLFTTLGIAAIAASVMALVVLRPPDNQKNTPNLALNHPVSSANSVTNGLPSTNASPEIARLVQDGKVLYEMHKLDEAKAKLQAAIAKDPTNKTADYYLRLVEAEAVYSSEKARVEAVSKVMVAANAKIDTTIENRSVIPSATPQPKTTLPTLTPPPPPPPTFVFEDVPARAVRSQNTGVQASTTKQDSLNAGLVEKNVHYVAGEWSIQATDPTVKDKIPVLGDIPLLGRLYRSSSSNGATTPGQLHAWYENNSANSSTVKIIRTNGNLSPVAFDYAFADGHVESFIVTPDGSERPVGLYSTGDRNLGTASYPYYFENKFISPYEQALSTFSIDVDTASYANMRRFLNQGQLPPHDAVRIEELINYFPYRYPQPKGDDAFQANIEIAGCPWAPEHRLVRIGIKGKEIARDKRPASNFVFLIDVSGSMQPSERLPLIKQALRMLVKKMTESDRVAIVVYASEAGVKLQSTSCANKERILEVIDALEAGGSTNGGEGIQQAYAVATQNFIKDGVNRVLLCTDGDFNVGITDQSDLIKLVQDKAKSGVFLTTIGVGTDNYKDATMQKLADKGNGNYYYLDTLEEAQKVLIEQMNGTLVTIAKDVKIQVEFNPAVVDSYRLIGYEKRLLRKQDFNDDTKDAGEIGAGHTITALYEVVPAGAQVQRVVDNLKYQPAAKPERYAVNNNKEMLTLKLRFKKPDGDKSSLLEFPVTDMEAKFDRASQDFRFAAAVAEFGLILKDSQFKGNATLGSVKEIAESSKGDDEHGYRAEFINLVKKAAELKK